jgi:hypothetical protein
MNENYDIYKINLKYLIYIVCTMKLLKNDESILSSC